MVPDGSVPSASIPSRRVADKWAVLVDGRSAAFPTSSLVFLGSENAVFSAVLCCDVQCCAVQFSIVDAALALQLYCHMWECDVRKCDGFRSTREWRVVLWRLRLRLRLRSLFRPRRCDDAVWSSGCGLRVAAQLSKRIKAQQRRREQTEAKEKIPHSNLLPSPHINTA